MCQGHMANKYGAEIHLDGLAPESVPLIATQLLYKGIRLSEIMYTALELPHSHSKKVAAIVLNDY